MLILLFLYGTALASSATDPTIDQQPLDKQGWYSAPNYRGTLDIVWPCLLTIFLCCWTAVHPEIPHPHSTWQQRYIDRAAYLVLSAIASEMFIYFALQDRVRAQKNYEYTVATLGKEKWTLTHAFYASMGGFYVYPKSQDHDTRSVDYMLEGSIISAFREGRLSLDSWITEKEIKDKGKADSLIKSLTILQLIWLIVQCIARLAQHLSLTTLELSTLAYVPCAMLMYYLWWNKPYEVNVPTILDLAPKGTFATDRVMSSSDSVSQVSGKLKGQSIGRYRRYGLLRRTWDENEVTPHLHMFLTIIFFIIGSVHIAGWNLSFPTPAEQWTWRACSIIITTALPLAWCIDHLIWWMIDDSHVSMKSNLKVVWWRYLPMGMCVMSYIFARLYLIVEVFIGLRAASKLVYRTPEWTNFLPHFG